MKKYFPLILVGLQVIYELFQIGGVFINRKTETTINVSSVGQIGGITAANVISAEKVRRTKIEPELILSINKIKISKNHKIIIFSVFADFESYNYANMLREYLLLNGWQNVDEIVQATYYKSKIIYDGGDSPVYIYAGTAI